MPLRMVSKSASRVWANGWTQWPARLRLKFLAGGPLQHELVNQNRATTAPDLRCPWTKVAIRRSSKRHPRGDHGRAVGGDVAETPRSGSTSPTPAASRSARYSALQRATARYGAVRRGTDDAARSVGQVPSARQQFGNANDSIVWRLKSRRTTNRSSAPTVFEPTKVL
jgi:hypothetical protein